MSTHAAPRGDHARALRAALLLCVTALAVGSCGPPRAPDYSSPQQTVATFCAAVGEEDSLGVYFCLSEALKERFGITVQKTDVALDILLEESPEIRWLASSEVIAYGVDQARGRAFVKVRAGLLWWTEVIRFDMVRTTKAELWFEGEKTPRSAFIAVDLENLERPNTVRDFVGIDPDIAEEAWVRVPSETLALLLLDEERSVRSIHIHDVWKIDGIQVPAQASN